MTDAPTDRGTGALLTLRTTVVLLLGVVGGTLVGWWVATARHSVGEGLLAGVAACGATTRFFHDSIEPDRR